MAGLLDIERTIGGIVKKIAHIIKGFRVDYKVIIDHTISPKTTVTFVNVPIKKTALVKQQSQKGGRLRDEPGGGGLFSREQQPFFEISREVLKADGVVQDSTGATPTAGTFYTPQIGDTFFDVTKPTDVFHVIQVIESAPEVASWILAFRTVFRSAASGGGGQG